MGDGNLSEPLLHWHVSKGAVAGLINPLAEVALYLPHGREGEAMARAMRSMLHRSKEATGRPHRRAPQLCEQGISRFRTGV